MSSGEKLAKGKTVKKLPPKSKSTKGKEVSLNDHRFRGDGVKFKCKLVGTEDVSNARGDTMCVEAIKKLKVQALKSHKESGEHKQRIVMYITLKGIRIVDEKSQKVQHEHAINKISFITHDPDDKKIFGYVCSQPCTTGHKLFAIKSEKPAGVVTGVLYELFQVVFKLRQEAGLTKKVPNSSPQVSNGPAASPQESDGIYEVPYKNGNNKQVKASPQVDHEYSEPLKAAARQDPHYKVPKNPAVQATLPPVPGEHNKGDAEVGETTASADVSNSSTLLSQSMYKEPDQVSQASIEPFTTLDNSSADMSFFSPSVFESAPGESGAADTTSLASADISVLRSGSVSSGSSETPSQDTRSVHSRSGSLLNQPEGFQAGFATAFDDKSDVGPSLGVKAEQEDWASESGNQGDIPVVLPPYLSDTNKENKFETPPVLETSASLESNPDPFASSDVSTKEDKRTQQVAGENFFINSFAAFDASFSDRDVKSDEDNKRKEDSSSNDPFASSSGAQENDNAFESAEGFVSETSFETAFGSEQFTPTQDSPVVVKDQTQEDSEDEKTAKDSLHQSVENSAVSFSWDNAFGETKMDTQPETTQSTVESDVQFSWKESFASEYVPETLAKSDPNTSASVSWDDAFGGGMATDKESSSQAQDAFSWDDAFGGGGMAADSSNLQFDSSAFGDAFAPSSTVEATSDVHSASEHSAQPALQPTEPDNLELGDIPSVSELNAQPVSQATLSDNPPLFDDMVFPTPSSSQFPECNTDVSGADESTDRPVLSKDPFEELTMSYPVPATKPGKIDLEETEDSSESEFSNANEDGLFAKENEPSELPSGENAKELNDVKEVDESLTHANQQSLDSDTEEEMDMKDKNPMKFHLCIHQSFRFWNQHCPFQNAPFLQRHHLLCHHALYFQRLPFQPGRQAPARQFQLECLPLVHKRPQNHQHQALLTKGRR
ncbi:Dab1p [Desmophyllum pertusum]|uniref:Dab1p n=1 Tax=Desmophyllum pertusum TaxID=174260 RepID=A0A9W9YBT7_9CNID|nr:Dab1p [Desmophyllum pertusum]